MQQVGDVTVLLQSLGGQSGPALDALLPVVYDELRALAQKHLRKERADHTLQPTALVHEAYLKLTHQRAIAWRDRVHFYAAAGQAIRRILVDHARGRNRLKRAGRRSAIPLDSVATFTVDDDDGILALEDALEKLHALDPRKARIVALRFFSGLTAAQVADFLGVTTRTVERDWHYSRAWLFRQLNHDCAPHPQEVT